MPTKGDFERICKTNEAASTNESCNDKDDLFTITAIPPNIHNPFENEPDGEAFGRPNINRAIPLQ